MELFKNPKNLSSDIQTYLIKHEHYLLQNYNNYFILNNITEISYNNFTPDITNLTFTFDIIAFFDNNINQNQINETKNYFLDYFNTLLRDEIYKGHNNTYIFILPLDNNNIYIDLYVNPETNMIYPNSMYIRIVFKMKVLPYLNPDVVGLIISNLKNPLKLLDESELIDNLIYLNTYKLDLRHNNIITDVLFDPFTSKRT